MAPRSSATVAALLATAHRCAAELPPFTEALSEYLWARAEAAVDGANPAGVDGQERFVCGVGKWGDGPQGNVLDQGFSPCWPSAMTVSASWDVELMALWSAELAEEFGVAGRGQLGPAVGLARFPWNGRLGESISGEDPYFGAKMVEAQVRAFRNSGHPPLQVLKNFAPSTIEHDRTKITEEVDERTLFEVYYPPFEAAVRGGVSGVMCSSNLVKCTSGLCAGKPAYACANDDLLNKHLKQVIGFKGVVMSAWGGTKCDVGALADTGCNGGATIDNDFAADAGLDLEIPACEAFRGGCHKRAREKAVRLQWAFMNQQRHKTGDLITRRLAVSGSETYSLQWRNHPNKCLQVASGEPRSGLAVQIWDCLDVRAQRFAWSGTFSRIRWAAEPSLCLSVADRDFSNGATLQLEDCGQDGNDQYFVLPFEDEGKILSLTHQAMCVDVSGHFTWNGAAIQIWECIESDDDQIFTVKQAELPEVDPPTTTGTLASTATSTTLAATSTTAATTTTQAPATPPPHIDTDALPRKGQAPVPGRPCADEGANNFKSTCKLALADRIIAESTVILKNDGDVLPLSSHRKLALVGREACAQDPVAQCSGSSSSGMACQVPKISVRDGIAGLRGGVELPCPGANGDSEAALEAEVVIVVVAAAVAPEGEDRTSLQLAIDDVALIAQYTALGKIVVVAMNAPGPVITSTWDSGVAAIAVSWLPGQQNGRGIAQALFREDYEASGRLPFTFPLCATSDCTLEDERISVALGDKIEGQSYLKFTEKALIGYRWYDANGLRVSYPFGFGLVDYGRSKVSYRYVHVESTAGGMTVSASLRLSGAEVAKDVPQLYLKFPDSVPGSREQKPPWVLKGFTKVKVFADEPLTVRFALTERDASYWDDAPGQSRWVCAGGEFVACVGPNARDAAANEQACAKFWFPCSSGSEGDPMLKAATLPHGEGDEQLTGPRALSQLAARPLVLAGGLAAALLAALAVANRRLRSAASGTCLPGRYAQVPP